MLVSTSPLDEAGTATQSKHQLLSNQQLTLAHTKAAQSSRLTTIRARSLLTRHTGDPEVIGWSALETTLAGPFLPLLSERGKCVAVPASSSGDVETSMEVTTNER